MKNYDSYKIRDSFSLFTHSFIYSFFFVETNKKAPTCGVNTFTNVIM